MPIPDPSGLLDSDNRAEVGSVFSTENSDGSCGDGDHYEEVIVLHDGCDAVDGNNPHSYPMKLS